MSDGLFSTSMVLLFGSLLAGAFVLFARYILPKRRKARRAEQRRKDRIDLISGTRE